MDKTIENIKKILHIGPKKGKQEKIEDFSEEKPKVKEKVITTKVEVTRGKPEDYEPVDYRG